MPESDIHMKHVSHPTLSWRQKVVSVFGFGHPKSLFFALEHRHFRDWYHMWRNNSNSIDFDELLPKNKCFFVLLALFFLQIYCVENKYYSPSKRQNMRIYSSSCCFSRSMCICQTGLRVCGGSSFKSLPRASLYNAIPSFWPTIVNCSHVDVAIQGKAWKLTEKIC